MHPHHVIGTLVAILLLASTVYYDGHRLADWFGTFHFSSDGKNITITAPLHKSELEAPKEAPIPKIEAKDIREISLPTQKDEVELRHDTVPPIYATEPPTAPAANVETPKPTVATVEPEPPKEEPPPPPKLAALPPPKAPADEIVVIPPAKELKPAPRDREAALPPPALPRDTPPPASSTSPYVPPPAQGFIPQNPQQAAILQWCQKYNRNSMAVSRCVRAELANANLPLQQLQPRRIVVPQFFRFPFLTR